MERLTKPIVIGTVGSGYGAFLHVNGYLNAGGIPIRLKTGKSGTVSETLRV